MPLNIERELGQLRNAPGMRWSYLALKKVVDNLNQLATNLSADTKALPAPPPVAGVDVKTSGTGLVHAVISDPAPIISRNVQYFLEYDTNPAFSQPHVEHLGASRSRVLRLPGKTDGGDAQTFYFRAYSQYLGSKHPSSPVVYGSPTVPSAVAPGGSDTLTLIPSTGSGTAANSGLEGGSGLGKVLHRRLVAG